MGHVRTFEIVNKKEDILPTAENFSYYNTDRYENPDGRYHGNLEIVENIIFDDEDEATEYLLSKFQGYHDGAVQFKDYPLPLKNKGLEEMQTKIQTLRKELSEAKRKNHFANISSKSIGCKSCDSKISAEFLKNPVYGNRENICPVCSSDLRPPSTLKKLSQKEEKLKTLIENFEKREDELKRKAKPTIKWLVKLEVHC